MTSGLAAPMSVDDPIAIIGVSCRFPSAPDCEAFWRLLCSGQDAVTVGYDDRRLGPDAGNDDEWVGRLRALRGGFLDAIDQFDASAFDISAREARLMDPQQRLLLEAAWEALDDAGQDMHRLAGRQVGVYAGVWGSDYQARLFRHFPKVDITMAAGGGRYAASGRVSYAFGFQGPSLTIDTACSSSLVAVHEACRVLRDGECELALAGGVNLLLEPAITLGYLNSGALSPDGRCKFGDASADGYVRSEGVGIVVLKPLSRARADGDPVYALIRSSIVCIPAGPAPRFWRRAKLASRAVRSGAGARGSFIGRPRLHRGARHRHQGRRPHRAGRPSQSAGARARQAHRPLSGRIGENQHRPY